MADVAFLLLIFFLVTTTIDVDSGIYMQLPPKRDPLVQPPRIPDRNLLTVHVNAAGEVVVEGEPMPMSRLRGEVRRHVLNEGRSPDYADSPTEAVVSFKTDRGARYGAYIAALDGIKAAYLDIRNDYARALAGADYPTYRARLEEGEPDAVAERYPIKISLAEPDA
jgi:biopolymer transport protein ExbD